MDELNARLDQIQAHINTASQVTNGLARTMSRLADLERALDKQLAGELDACTLARFSLTPTESRVASALFKGMTVKDYAFTAGIKVSTVRFHLKQIYSKTGAHRQPDLVRILLQNTL